MAAITIGTFNVQNLFFRYELLDQVKKGFKVVGVDPDKLTINDFRRILERSGPVAEAERDATARVLLEHKPDLVAVQEVENIEVLDRFNREYLKKHFRFMMVIDGNDPRQIDVGVLSRFDIISIRSHRFEPPGSPPTGRIFSRDCLAVTVEPAPGLRLTMYVNHFKSKLPTRYPDGTVDDGSTKRARQAKRMAEIVKRDFPDGKGLYVVAGDLNAGPREAALKPLVSGHGAMENVLDRLPQAERWTHFYDRAKKGTAPQEQFDYLLLSPDLTRRTAKELPRVERRGLSEKIVNRINRDPATFGGPIERFADAGTASDHCGVFLRVPMD